MTELISRCRDFRELATQCQEKELERDFNRVLWSRACGEIMVAYESHMVKAGKRKVIDKVSKGKSVVKVAVDVDR
jgi:hypothetical protein